MHVDAIDSDSKFIAQTRKPSVLEGDGGFPLNFRSQEIAANSVFSVVARASCNIRKMSQSHAASLGGFFFSACFVLIRCTGVVYKHARVVNHFPRVMASDGG